MSTNQNIELENHIKGALSGDMLVNALDFVTFLNANNMTFADSAVN
ncbi:MAG: hypothetical protein FWE90_05850 [Defluviitaleaceae bacterium]|nr:hypothetical protein [Defluviitaleaceae bacterium]